METMFSCFPSDAVGLLRLNPQRFTEFPDEQTALLAADVAANSG